MDCGTCRCAGRHGGPGSPSPWKTAAPNVIHMPRPGPRRPIVTVRVDQEDLTEVDRLATAEGVGRSEMVRRLLVEAMAARRA
ncbi:ribbon-helix-helix domain-containing protein [Aquipuribacter hungaricus]|uniref:ribbon-helix-helix domain-containing protein n=1 Tax=Aquipuribacter hungaricus TaxID=545624 RepID=UPI003611F9EF